jgi:N,N'-diacetyllegionaminate synthase
MVKKRTYIIAEVGPNHNGSFSLAKKIIRELKNSGVDAIKFQIANPDLVYSDDAILAKYQRSKNYKSIKEMSIKNQLKNSHHLELSKICKRNKIEYLCSAFDLESLKFLIEKIKIPIIKIPSGEITSLDMLEYLSKINKSFFISTGMSNKQDIANALKILNKKFKKKITLLYCVSSYPAPNKILNLSAMNELKSFFKLPVGYSDHSIGFEAPLAAVAAGAEVIEKHITLSKKFIGPDHKFSMEIHEFKLLIKKIRDLELMMFGSKNKLSKKEEEIKLVARKSIVTTKFLKKGTILKKTFLTFKRPGTGISPLQIKKVLGKKLNLNINQNKVLQFKNFK